MIQESHNIEYKSSWRDEYLKWICGFANAQGGKLYIGKDDNGKVIGEPDAKRLMEDIPNKITNVLGIVADVNLLETSEGNCIEISVSPQSNPVNYKGEYHYRSGSTKQELKCAALDKFLLGKQGKRWDSVLYPNVSVAELKVDTFNFFRKRGIKARRLDDDTLSDSNELLLNNLKLTQAGKDFTYSLKPELKDITSISGKGDAAGKVTFGDNGVVTVGTLGDANAISLNGKDGKISMGKVSLSKEGLDNGGNKITNVAAGTDPTDAVNVSQLRDAAGNMQAITNQLQGQVNRVGSQAAALSALKPIQYDPLEPTQIMAGVGHYQGQNSLALGVAHYKNESMMFHAGAAIGGNHSQVMANAGITWKVGSKADETAVADVYRQGPISSAYVLQDKMAALEAQNLEQKGEINALREENKSQRAELDAVKAQLATVLSRLQG